MTVTAQVICDSISPECIRITTVLLKYPKFIHGELMTHRVFSRNAGSSRAIPVSRLLRFVKDEPAEPLHWGLNEKGMQASQEAKGWRLWALKMIWRSARRAASRRAWLADKVGGHKQIVNRLIETHGHINVLVTSTHWENFHALRDHPAAQPEIRRLSQRIHLMMDASRPKLLLFGEWHLPYVTEFDRRTVFEMADLQQISAARCARTSYLTMDGQVPSIVDDLKLFKRLAGGEPIHASPLEHQATPDIYDRDKHVWVNKNLWGNFYGWCQYRKYVPGESTKEYFEADQYEPPSLSGPGTGSRGGVHNALRSPVLRKPNDGRIAKAKPRARGRNVVAKKPRSRKGNC